MADIPGSRDRAMEAIDFIIRVLNEHEQVLDASIHALANISEAMGETAKFSVRVEGIEERIDSLQQEINKLSSLLLKAPRPTATTAKQQQPITTVTQAPAPTDTEGAPVMVLDCKLWEDFQALSIQAQTLSYSFKDGRVFQAEAIKANRIISYSGVLPNFPLILKTWLSKTLGMSEQNIFEGFTERPK